MSLYFRKVNFSFHVKRVENSHGGMIALSGVKKQTSVGVRISKWPQHTPDRAKQLVKKK